MTIKCGELIQALNEGGADTYNKLAELRKTVKQIMDDWTKKNFIEVRVVNSDGNITSCLIKEFPKYEIWWEGETGCCGENIILVPAEDWNDDLKEQIADFDSDVGHHQETRRDWKLIDGVKLPYDLSNAIDELKARYIEKNGAAMKEVIIPGYAFSNWPFHKYEGSVSEYFTEHTTVTREWDVELNVIDKRKYVKDTLKDVVIEI